MKILSAKICGLAILAMAFTFAASAQNLLVNGGFDAPSGIDVNSPNGSWPPEKFWYFSTNEYVTSPDPSSLLGGTWTYTKGISDFDSLFTTDSLNPDYSVSLGGGGEALGGSIVQSFNAAAGSVYTASLDVGYIGGREPVGIRFSILDAANLNQIVSSLDVSTSSLNFPTSRYTFTTYSFQFTAPSTNLAFKVEDISAYGPSTDVLINSASVVAVPEPSTYALLGSGLLIVFWTFLRRRRTSCSSSH